MAPLKHPRFPNLKEIHHPLLQHKLTILRRKETNKKEFKELLHEITLLLVYEATRQLPLKAKTIRTPNESFDALVLEDEEVVILPILRAGIGMVDSFLSLLPKARVAHIGLFRDEVTLEPHCYYFKIPEHCQDKQFFICDPMLATGGSAIAAIDRLSAEGIKKIIYVCVLAAPEGVKQLSSRYPDIQIFTASLDRELDKRGYILPGLGDAGDRLFGTK